MGIKQKKLGLGLALCFWAFSVTSQEPDTWTLQDCIDQAVKNNLSVQESELETNRAELQYDRSKEDRYPSVNFNMGHTYNFGRTIDRFTNDFATEGVHSNNLGLSANFTLFDGFRKQRRLSKNEKTIEARKKGTEEEKWNIRKNVIQAYMDVLLNKALLESRQNRLEALTNEVEATKKRVKAGDQTKADLLDLKADRAGQEVEVTNAENNLKLAKLQLRQLMQLDSGASFNVKRPESVEEKDAREKIPETTKIFEAAKNQHPGLERIRLEKQLAKKEQEIARSDYYPTLTMQGSLGSGYSGNRQEVVDQGELVGRETVGVTENGQKVLRPVYDPNVQTVPYWEQLDNNFNQSISLSLNIPIYDGNRADYNVEEARINRQVADRQLKQRQNQLLNDIESARTDALAAAKRYEATKQSVKAHETALENAGKRMEAGMGTSYRYSEALSNLQEAESEMLRARYEMRFKKALLDMFMGDPTHY